MELSLVANFDDLRRCNDVLTDGTAEIGKNEIVMLVLATIFLNNFHFICFVNRIPALFRCARRWTSTLSRNNERSATITKRAG